MPTLNTNWRGQLGLAAFAFAALALGGVCFWWWTPKADSQAPAREASHSQSSDKGFPQAAEISPSASANTALPEPKASAAKGEPPAQAPSPTTAQQNLRQLIAAADYRAFAFNALKTPGLGGREILVAASQECEFLKLRLQTQNDRVLSQLQKDVRSSLESKCAGFIANEATTAEAVRSSSRLHEDDPIWNLRRSVFGTSLAPRASRASVAESALQSGRWDLLRYAMRGMLACESEPTVWCFGMQKIPVDQNPAVDQALMLAACRATSSCDVLPMNIQSECLDHEGVCSATSVQQAVMATQPDPAKQRLIIQYSELFYAAIQARAWHLFGQG
jgi:hypothetical protein